jgi:hypothetical protein
MFELLKKIIADGVEEELSLFQNNNYGRSVQFAAKVLVIL